MKLRPWLWLALIPLGFFLWGFATLGNYGVNVDEPFHFMRGQAYLHMYLTGKQTFDDVPGFNDYIRAAANKTASDESVAAQSTGAPLATPHRFSTYMQPTLDAETLLKTDVGHPPLPDILAAGVNKVFYQELGWMGDIPSYHLFEISLATLGVVVVMLWAYTEFGLTASLIAGLALALHPMFLGESRFNIKDPEETVFFLTALWAVWRAVRINRPPFESKNRAKQTLAWLALGGLAFGAGMATKFNAAFVLPILGSWFVLMFVTSRLHQDKATKRPFVATLGQWFSPAMVLGYLLAGLLAAGLAYAAWPNLWHGQALSYIGKVLAFYRQLGEGTNYTPQFLTPNGWNLYPILDVLFRAPLVTELLFAVSVAGFIRYWKKPQFATLLLLAIWIVIPILRVSLPGSSIYGATRQIMEYIPALALMAGVGAQMIVDAVRHHWPKATKLPMIMSVVIALFYLPIAGTLIRLNPNPQLFYNSLIGGLKGAYDIDFPYWNNTMNNAYVSGIDWLNTNAEPNAHLSLVLALRSSLPPNRLRSDIDLSNRYFSGPLQSGEYIMETLPIPPTNFTAKYIEKFLKPVYTYQVDGVPLLQIWHNDGLHRLSPAPTVPTQIQATLSGDATSATFDFGAVRKLDRLELFTPPVGTILPKTTVGCVALTEGALSVSVDGKLWRRLENIPFVGVNQPVFQTHDIPDYLFAGEQIRYVSVSPNANACLLHPVKVLGWVEQ